MKKLMIVVLTMLSFQAMALSERALKEKLKDAIQAYNWTCEGDVCFSIWGEEIRSLNSLSDLVDSQLTESVTLETTTGRLAHRLAEKICTYWATGDQGWMYKLVSSENRALSRLRLVQSQAGVKVHFCQRKLQ